MKETLRSYILQKKHRAERRVLDIDFAEQYCREGLSLDERVARRFETVCAAERAVLLPDESICFMRTVIARDGVVTEREKELTRNGKPRGYIHEFGHVSNMAPDYAYILKNGFAALYDKTDDYGRRMLDALFALTDKYRAAALDAGDTALAEVLAQVPRYPARTLREALQFVRIITFALRLEGTNHVTVGRFDKYIYPYYEQDIKSGVITKEEAYALIVDFFLSFNKDTDLYLGVQQGDNGQSMVLGGLCDGREIFNDITVMSLKASRENLMIDPKINLRVSSKTPIEVYELGSELTKAGLGFPQYSNDDIVIPTLIKWGYDPKDAENYVVAACWEFIIEGVGMDIPNIGALSFPAVIDRVMREQLEASPDFDSFCGHIKNEINARLDAFEAEFKNLKFAPCPLTSLCVHSKDLRLGGKYNNFGIHGTGLSTAADSLTAIKKHVFDDKTLTARELIQAVDRDFEGEPGLLHTLRYGTPKMGQNDSYADDSAVFLLAAFSDAMQGRKNEYGGIYRAGTGSAMYYLWHAAELGASPDGRRKGEPFSANYSPSLFARTDGPMSIIASFTKPDLAGVCNGGPLTLEFDGGIFDCDESIGKVARLVKSFIEHGGHQLQLNAVDPAALREAQVDPEKYSQLIVRIWGWSAYFTELDKSYQDHVIARQEYSI